MKMLSLLLLGFFLSDASAFLPLLGDVEHPLLHWGPQHLMKLLDINSTSMMRCIQSPNAVMVMNKFSEAAACASTLGQQSDTPPSPNDLCRAYGSFSRCFHGVAIEIAEACEFNMKDTKFINDAVDNNGEILESLCEDNGERMMTYQMFGGMDCAMKKKDELLQCANDSMIMGEPGYDGEGCTSAANFMDCAVREIGSCSEEAGEVLRKVSEDALEDLCRDQTGSVGQLPYEFDGEGYDDDSDGSFMNEHHGPRMGRGKYQMMERQVELMEEMNKSLKTIVTILNKNNELLEKMTQAQV